MRNSSNNFLLILFIVFLISGCNKTQQQNSDLISVGVILPMTGELASYGEPMRKGLEMALEELNSNELNDNLRYELKYVDSQGNATTAVNGLQKLLMVDEVQYFIGDVSSPVTLAIMPIIENNQTFLLSPGASSPRLENISPFFARNYPSSTAESIEAARFMYNERDINKTAIIYVNNEFGIGLRKTFTETYSSLGGEITFSESYEFGQTNFRNLITRLQSVQSEAIYLGGNPREMGNFMRQLREVNSEILVVSNISFLQDDCLNIAGDAANGVIVPVAYYNPNDSTMSGAYEFAKKYQSKFDGQPNIPIAVGYDALMLIAEAIEEVGNNPREVAEYIRNLKNYNGALGNISFTDGEVEIPMVFQIVRDGKSVKLETYN